MAEENINKKTGAERQAEILIAALERVSENGGILLNTRQKTMPQFYDKTEMKRSIAPEVDGTPLHEENEHREYHEEQKREQQVKADIPPIIKQYNDLKQKHPDALLLFRCGDFYETYKDDAVKASNILGITLTQHSKRKDDEGKPLKMAGFPYHALDTYLPKLIRAGERIAICDQLESPKQKEQTDESKTEAKQEVKEVVSQQKEQRHGMHR